MQVLWEDLMRQNVIHVAFHSVCESKDAGFGDPWCTPDRLKAVLETITHVAWIARFDPTKLIDEIPAVLLDHRRDEFIDIDGAALILAVVLDVHEKQSIVIQ